MNNKIELNWIEYDHQWYSCKPCRLLRSRDGRDLLLSVYDHFLYLLGDRRVFFLKGARKGVYLICFLFVTNNESIIGPIWGLLFGFVASESTFHYTVVDFAESVFSWKMLAFARHSWDVISFRTFLYFAQAVKSLLPMADLKGLFV